MIYILAYLCFFAVCETNITIDIKTTPILFKTIILYEGNDVKLITDKEIILFNITKQNLNKGVRVELGKIPNNIYLKEPTPNALYHKYKWPEVERKLKVKSVTALKFMKRDQVLQTHVFVNNTTDIMKTQICLREVVENIASFKWSEKGLPEDEIYFGLNVTFGNGNLSFVQKWRCEKLQSTRLPIKTSKVVVENGSGNILTSKLIASHIILLLEVEFQAYLIGNVITDYENLYGKYHYYSPTVHDIMRAGEIKNELITKSLLELRFYTDVRLEVVDEATGKSTEYKNKGNLTMNQKDIHKLRENTRVGKFLTPT